MPLTIWKYPLAVDASVLEMPMGAKVLSVGVQGAEDAVLWALVDPEAPKMKRRVRVYGTGHLVENETGELFEFAGTFQLAALGLVFHVFVERRERTK